MLHGRLRTVAASVLLIGLAVLLAAQPTRAEGTWTLLPQAQWTDQFSPRYVSPSGNMFIEGDPNASDDPDPPALLTRQVWDEENQENIAVQYVANEALVNFKGTATAADIESLFDTWDLEIVSAWFDPNSLDVNDSISWFQVKILATSAYYNDVPGLIAAFFARSDVSFADYNDILMTNAFPTDPPNDTYYGANHEIPSLGAAVAWQTELGSSNTTCVAVLDSGVDVGHVDLTDQIYKDSNGKRQGIAVINGKKYSGDVDDTNNSALRTLQTTRLGHGHGTCVAGIVAAKTNNGKGVAGCGPGLKILSARVWMPSAYGFQTSDIVGAVKEVAKSYPTSSHPVRVVNMSFGGSYKAWNSDSIGKAIYAKGGDLRNKDASAKNDRLYVASAGNDGKERKQSPAAWDFVLGVTGAFDDENASSRTDKRAKFSNYWNGGGSGSTVDTAVYGATGYFWWTKTTDVTGKDGFREDNYVEFGGTSAAAPQVAALAGLLYAVHPTGKTYSNVADRIKLKTKGSDSTDISFTVGSNTKKIRAVAGFDRAVSGW